MKNLLRLLAFVFLVNMASAEEQVTVTPLVFPEGVSSGEIQGNISGGVQIPMEWAAQSSVALVPATRFEQFRGNHVFYRIELPARSLMKLRLYPENGKQINLYALRQGIKGPHATPPNIRSAISSEASYPIYANLADGRRITSRRNKPYREVEFMSINRPYSILIGVCGAQGVNEGSYRLQLQVTGR